MEGWEGDADDDDAGRSAGELLSREMRGDDVASEESRRRVASGKGMGPRGFRRQRLWLQRSRGKRGRRKGGVGRRGGLEVEHEASK
jgi:hypothetical protein